VLDLCAGAGGKSLALAALLDNHGSIVATDIESDKLRDLKQRARRAGAHNVRPIRIAKDDWPEDVAEFARGADRILCDVPCSGLGVLRRNTDQRWRIPQEQLEIISGVQKKLARRAAQALQPGARMVYSTCSVLRAENEDVVEELLKADSGLETVRIAEILGNARALPIADPGGTFLKTWTHRHGTDGFFAAVLRRKR
jgi:16S rRNA (cytosine967-C5)-methyltransferase